MLEKLKDIFRFEVVNDKFRISNNCYDSSVDWISFDKDEALEFVGELYELIESTDAII